MEPLHLHGAYSGSVDTRHTRHSAREGDGVQLTHKGIGQRKQGDSGTRPISHQARGHRLRLRRPPTTMSATASDERSRTTYPQREPCEPVCAPGAEPLEPRRSWQLLTRQWTQLMVSAALRARQSCQQRKHDFLALRRFLCQRASVWRRPKPVSSLLEGDSRSLCCCLLAWLSARSSPGFARRPRRGRGAQG